MSAESGVDAAPIDAKAISVMQWGPRENPSIMAQVIKLEKKLFPKNMSMHEVIESDCKKRNSVLLVAGLLEQSPAPPRAAKKPSDCDANSSPTVVCGYLLYRIAIDGCYISKVAVDHAFRKQGIASRLVQQCVQTNSSKPVTLHVDVENQAAYQLYLKNSFAVHARLLNYYREGKDAYYMKFDES